MDELDLLRILVASKRPGFDELREQARHARVVASTPGVIVFDVPRSAPASPARGPVSSHTAATLWVAGDGYIDSVDIADGASPSHQVATRLGLEFRAVQPGEGRGLVEAPGGSLVRAR
jgi:hypothetical protein